MAMPSVNMETIETNSRTARIQRPCRKWPSPGTSQPAIKTMPAANACDPASARAASCLTLAFVVDIFHEYTSRKAVSPVRSDPNQLPLQTACDFRFAGTRHDIHFAAHDKVGQINSRLDGKTRVGKQQTFVMRLKIVEVGATAVDLGGNVVTGAMGKIFAETGIPDYAARRIVSLPSSDRFVGRKSAFHQLDNFIAGRRDGSENLLFTICRLAIDDTGPGDVVEDRAWRIFSTPDIDQHEIPDLDRLGIGSARIIVWIGGIPIDGNVRSILRNDLFPPHGLTQPLHHGKLRQPVAGTAASNAVAYFTKAVRKNSVNTALSSIMALDLFLCKHRFKMADQVRRTDNLLVHASQQFNGAGIDQRHVHDGVARRILHRQPGAPLEHRGQLRFQFLPG